jgi:hypothetical protein
MVNIVNTRQLSHLIHPQKVEVPQKTKHQGSKDATNRQGQSDGCKLSKASR